jgi:hypothetical protein
MPPHRVFGRRRRSVVQQRAPQPQPPERRRADLFLLGRTLHDAVAGAHVVQQQIGEERHRLAVEQRVAARARVQHRVMAGGAADGGKHLLAGRGELARAFARHRTEEAHEAGEVVDAAPPRDRVSDVFRVADPIAGAHPLGRHAEGDFGREDVVRDPHLVAVGVGAEREERRVLRLPAEAADAPLARGRVHDRAARPDTPSRSRSVGSSRATMVSSGMASTRPAPKSGIGTRRANTLASAGTMAWQPWVGIEKRWKSVSPVASNVSKRPVASRRPARISAIVPAPPIAGTLWHAAQLVPLKAGPSPSSAVSTSRSRRGRAGTPRTRAG